MLQAHEFLSSDSWMTPTHLARQAKTSCRSTSVPQDCDRTFSVILHCEGHYTGPVTAEIFSHFLSQVFFLAFGVPLHCYEPYISGIFCTYSWTSMCQTNRITRRPDTISSHISSRSHGICTGRHTSYNEILRRSVQIDVRRRRSLTEGDVATTGAQLLAQVMASDVGRRVWFRKMR